MCFKRHFYFLNRPKSVKTQPILTPFGVQHKENFHRKKYTCLPHEQTVAALLWKMQKKQWFSTILNFN